MNAYQKTAIATIIATIFLISVGSLVRITGAGLGCPDWPKCWGCWFPPSSIEEVDMAYIQEKGYDIQEFNPIKMWTEYINRLVGVIIGFLVFLTFLRSVRYLKSQPAIFWYSCLSFALVGFQGWLGGQVVRSGLQPGIITLHMALAVILLCVLIYATFKTGQDQNVENIASDFCSKLTRLSILLFVFTCIQMLIGTQVREGIDPFIKDAGGLPRSEWLGQVGMIDHVHRLSSWLVLITGILIYRAIKTTRSAGLLPAISRWLLAGIISQIFLGVLLAYASLPPYAQVLHLTLATLLLCGEWYLILVLRHPRHDVGTSAVQAVAGDQGFASIYH